MREGEKGRENLSIIPRSRSTTSEIRKGVGKDALRDGHSLCPVRRESKDEKGVGEAGEE